MPTAPTPTLTLLGSPHLQRGETRLELPDALPGYLVAYLCARSDWVLRQELAVLLWPQAAEDEAQHNLRVNLSRLRPHLVRWGIDALLVAERRRLRLDVDTDVKALRAAHARAAWSAAVEAARGLFLDGLSFRAFPVLGEWARSEREALRSLWRDALLRAAEGAAPQACVDLATRYLACDPLDEDVLRVQLGALAALGRGEEAQRLFAEFNARSRAELGVGATQALAAYAHRLATAVAGDAAMPVKSQGDDPLIGREADLAALEGKIAGSPLVTLVGLGGIGKTRLARAAQAQMAGQFAGGAIWLSLIDLSGVAEIARRLADALQVTLAGGRDPVEQVAAAVGSRPVLLILDNAEHLLGERAALNALLTQMLAPCQRLRCLVTSREPLGHPLEQLHRLEGLAVPGADVTPAALGAPAVQLLVQQARRVRPSFDPRGAIDDLAQIARLTGGMPLALRIAAAWLRFLSSADIAAEIRRGLDALEPGSTHHVGVRATLARTWQQLSLAEKSALARLSVFAGPFSAQAARDVANAALPAIGSLADRCLLSPAGDAGDRVHLELHPLVRAFAWEQLAVDRSAQEQARERHARHVARLLAPWSDFRRIDQRKALIAIGAVLEEALAAWHWALGAGRADLIAELANPLSNYLEQKGRWDEGITLFSQAERSLDPERSVEQAALATVGRALAVLLYRKGDFDAAEDQARRTLVWARAIDHHAGIKGCLNTLGLSLWMLGRSAEAMAPVSEAHELARADHDRVGEAMFAGTLALLRKDMGDFAAAERGWREALAIHREVGNWRSAANVLNNLGNTLRLFKRYEEASAMLDEGLRLCDEHGFASTRPFLLINLAQVHADAGRLAAATTFAQSALEEVRRSGERKVETASNLVLGVLAVMQGDMALAARHLHDALKLARITGDVGNHLEGLDGYARWCEAQGRPDRALAVRLAILAHPQLHAELRMSIEARSQGAPPAAARIANARLDAQRTDVLALTEQALRELDSAAALLPAPAG